MTIAEGDGRAAPPVTVAVMAANLTAANGGGAAASGPGQPWPRCRWNSDVMACTLPRGRRRPYRLRGSMMTIMTRMTVTQSWPKPAAAASITMTGTPQIQPTLESQNPASSRSMTGRQLQRV